MKYFTVSDVHSFYTPLVTALNQWGFDINNPDHKLVVCGDLMDRGKEALKVQGYILNLMGKDKVILIRGNHEDLILQMAEESDPRYIPDYHITNGTLDTACQLCGFDVLRSKNFKKRLLSTPFCSTIMPAMKNYFETPHYIFVHGWIPCITEKDMPAHYRYGRTYSYDPGWRSADANDWRTARWSNGMELAHKYKVKEPGKTIVCGHWHCSFGWSHYKQDRKEFPRDNDGKVKSFQPYTEDGLIAIDACTAYSGFVNCIVIED